MNLFLCCLCKFCSPFILSLFTSPCLVTMVVSPFPSFFVPLFPIRLSSSVKMHFLQNFFVSVLFISPLPGQGLPVAPHFHLLQLGEFGGVAENPSCVYLQDCIKFFRLLSPEEVLPLQSDAILSYRAALKPCALHLHFDPRSFRPVLWWTRLFSLCPTSSTHFVQQYLSWFISKPRHKHLWNLLRSSPFCQNHQLFLLRTLFLSWR